MRLEHNRDGLRNSQSSPFLIPDHKLDYLEFDIAHRDIVLHARKLTIQVTSDTIPILASFFKERKDLSTSHPQQLQIHVYDQDIPLSVSEFKNWASAYLRPLLGSTFIGVSRPDNKLLTPVILTTNDLNTSSCMPKEAKVKFAPFPLTLRFGGSAY